MNDPKICLTRDTERAFGKESKPYFALDPVVFVFVVMGKNNFKLNRIHSNDDECFW